MEHISNDDYSNALLSIAWRIKKDCSRKLIFALVEYYPADYKLLHETDEKYFSYKLNKNNKGHIYFIRKKITIEEANCIFKEVSENDNIPMLWQDKEKKINCNNMIMFPKDSSYTITSQEYSKDTLPFIPDHWGVCKLKHFIPQHIDDELKEIFSYEKTVNWLSDNIYWNIYDYSSLIGSVHFLYPNPLFRDIEIKLNKKENSEEYVSIKVIPYQDRNMDDLKLITAEKSEFGLSNFKISNLSYVQNITLFEPVSKFAMAIYSNKYNLLYYTNFCNFLKRINLNIGVLDEVRKITVPVTNEEYQVEVYNNISNNTIGYDDYDDKYEEVGKRITVTTRQLIMDRNTDEKIFTNNSAHEAREYIRNIIGNARECVTVIDPYFDTIACFDYLLAVKQKNIRINIIMGKPGGGYISNIDGYKEGEEPKIKEELPIALKDIRKKMYNTQIHLYVIKGKNTIIHDRFLIVDNNVWLSGNSLNHLGERYSMIIKLKNPTPVKKIATDIMNNKQEVDEIILEDVNEKKYE